MAPLIELDRRKKPHTPAALRLVLSLSLATEDENPATRALTAPRCPAQKRHGPATAGPETPQRQSRATHTTLRAAGRIQQKGTVGGGRAGGQAAPFCFGAAPASLAAAPARAGPPLRAGGGGGGSNSVQKGPRAGAAQTAGPAGKQKGRRRNKGHQRRMISEGGKGKGMGGSGRAPRAGPRATECSLAHALSAARGGRQGTRGGV